MNISIIVAVSENNVIGAKNKLLWSIPDDLKRFKKLTTSHHILMGQKTFESIGRVLPNRTNVILSFEKNYKADGAFVFTNINEALEFIKKRNEEELFVIGGGMIYKELLPQANKIYLTKVHKSYDGDTYFPEINEDEWKETFSEQHLENNPSYEYKILERL
ncbi:MAG: dihydrofolate reductase [bacterium]|nr:MAG: dihydrofolate reductase [bacterium]